MIKNEYSNDEYDDGRDGDEGVDGDFGEKTVDGVWKGRE